MKNLYLCLLILYSLVIYQCKREEAPVPQSQNIIDNVSSNTVAGTNNNSNQTNSGNTNTTSGTNNSSANTISGTGTTTGNNSENVANTITGNNSDNGLNNISGNQFQLPTNLVYSPSIISITSGIATTTNAPTLNGTSPFSFSILNNPKPDLFSINNMGAIVISNTSSSGTYLLDIRVTNQAGSADFTNSLQIIVSPAASSAAPPSTPSISYALDIAPILQNRGCNGCHSYSFATAKAEAGPSSSANTILNRINRTQGSAGFMPRNGTKLPQSEIDKIQAWFDSGMNP